MADAGVIVVRRERAFRFFLRAFKIHVNGSQQATVKNGRERHLVVPAGPHEVRVTLDWQGSAPLPVDVPPAGTVALVCGPTRDPLAATHAGQRDYEAILLRAE